MEQANDKSFNCAESVLIRVNRDNSLPEYSPCCMKVTSVLGGGVAGSGEVCGAISGAIVCLALLFGTNGDEPIEAFKTKRSYARSLIKTLMQNFIDDWGYVQCRNLLAMDRGTNQQIGVLRHSTFPRNHCEDYVDWAVKKTIEIRKSNPS